MPGQDRGCGAVAMAPRVTLAPVRPLRPVSVAKVCPPEPMVNLGGAGIPMVSVGGQRPDAFDGLSLEDRMSP